MTAEAPWRGEAVVKASGVFSATAEAFIIKGSGSLTFDVDGVGLSSRKFNVRLARMPPAGKAAMNIEIGIPFASVSLDDGTRTTLSRIPTVAAQNDSAHQIDNVRSDADWPFHS